MDATKLSKSKYAAEVGSLVKGLEALRRDPQNPLDISLEEMVAKRYGISMDSYYEEMGFNPCRDSISLLQNVGTVEGIRYLVPEIIRSSLKLGLRKASIWQDLIAAEETISQTSAVVPHFNMSDATPSFVGEAETIPTGNVSHGSKSFKIRKIGKGIKLSYELTNYASANILGTFLQDFGTKLNYGIDSLLIDTLINGEQPDGSESAPVVGVITTGTIVYKDLLKIWVRMSRLGKLPNSIIGGEDAALLTLDLPEFKTTSTGGTAPAGIPSSSALSLKSPIPKNSNYYIHGSVPADQQLIVEPSSAVIKYNSQPLLLETDKIISNQTIETYASLTTGFAVLYRDSRIIMDHSVPFASNGFPAYMDPSKQESVIIE